MTRRAGTECQPELPGALPRFGVMPGPKDKKRAVALKRVWDRLRAYIAAETARLPSPRELLKKVEDKFVKERRDR